MLNGGIFALWGETILRLYQIEDEAGSFLSTCDAGAYDFIFLDSDRGQYADWWPSLQRVLADGHLLVVDNAVSHAHQMEDFNRLVAASDGQVLVYDAGP